MITPTPYPSVSSTPSTHVPTRFRFCVDASECGHSTLPARIASETASWIQFAYRCALCDRVWVMGWSKEAAAEQSRANHQFLLEDGLTARNASEKVRVR